MSRSWDDLPIAQDSWVLAHNAIRMDLRDGDAALTALEAYAGLSVPNVVVVVSSPSQHLTRSCWNLPAVDGH